jgi:hypothetical protein
MHTVTDFPFFVGNKTAANTPGTKKGKSVTVCIGQILDIDDQEFQLKYMKKSGKTYIWPDKRDISWETDDKLVATVAEPTMSDKRSHLVFDY